MKTAVDIEKKIIVLHFREPIQMRYCNTRYRNILQRIFPDIATPIFFWYCNAFYLEEKKRLNNHHKISRGTKHGWCICKQEAWRPTCIPKISGQSGPFIIYCILTSKSAVAQSMPPVDWKWTRSRLIFLVCESYKKPLLYIIIFWSFTEQQNDCLSLYQGGIFFQLLFIPCCFWCSLENFE